MSDCDAGRQANDTASITDWDPEGPRPESRGGGSWHGAGDQEVEQRAALIKPLPTKDGISTFCQQRRLKQTLLYEFSKQGANHQTGPEESLNRKFKEARRRWRRTDQYYRYMPGDDLDETPCLHANGNEPIFPMVEIPMAQQGFRGAIQ